MWLVYTWPVLQSEHRLPEKLSHGTLGEQQDPVHCLCFTLTGVNGCRPYSECKSRMEHALSVSAATNLCVFVLVEAHVFNNGSGPLGRGIIYSY